VKLDIIVRDFWPKRLTALPRAVYEISSRIPPCYQTCIHTDRNPYVESETKFGELLIKPHSNLTFNEVSRDSDVVHFFGSLIGAYNFLRLVKSKESLTIVSLYTSQLNWNDLLSLKFSDFFRDGRTRFLLNPLLSTLTPDFVLKGVLEKADKIIVNGLDSKAFYQNLVLGEKVIRIPHGVDIARFRPVCKENAKRSIGLDPSKKIVLYAGHSYLIRGIDDLIYSVKLVSKQIPDVFLVLLLNPMPNSPITFIRNLATKTLGSNVKVITRYVENIDDYFNAADIVALPYRCAGELPSYPFILLEAMACGKPVVTTRIGAIPDIIFNERNGLLTSPKSSGELAISIIRLLRDENLSKQIGSNARESIKEFDWNIVAKRLEDVYENG
jgi:glycosyltransferase involved in cell wall biosynthesis